MEANSSVGQQIKRLREAQGLTLTELARISKLSKGYLSEIESTPTARPSASTLLQIAKALGITVGELIDPDDAADQRETVDIPSALRDFAKEANLPEDDVRMLAGIRYRGKAPKDINDWRYIYESIRMRIQGR